MVKQCKNCGKTFNSSQKHKILCEDYHNFHHIRFNNCSDKEMYKNFISCQVKDWYKENYCLTHSKNLIRIKYNKNSDNTFDKIYSGNYQVINETNVDFIKCFDINYNDFINYKEVCFNIASGISCTFKCNKECGQSICQNQQICGEAIHTLSINSIIEQFNSQSIATSICFQGLEPLDNLKQLLWFVYKFRKTNNNTIIIWTGYSEEECEDLVYLIQKKMRWKNIIIKYGRFRPNQNKHYDELLGVYLASDNQYAKGYNIIDESYI